MDNEKDSYKKIFKATSIFGGLQVFNIIISILKSKIVAVLLGPAGLGIISIFNSTVSLISSCTNFGIGTSAVKSIASTNQDENKISQSTIITVVKKLVWVTGLLAFFVTIIVSPFLSKISFGDYSYTISFSLLGIALLALQINNGQTAILQGLREIKSVALSSLIGASFGFVISLPLYYFFGQDGIVPAIVLTSLLAALTSWYFLKRKYIGFIKVNMITLKKDGILIVKLGFLISLTAIFPAIVAYFVRIFISNVGTIEDVGFYTAGFAIIGTYVGMIFTAMSTDYYPSLAEVSNDNSKCNEKVNQQILVCILILSPLLMIMLVFLKIGIIILYTSDFLGTVKMIQWACLGIFFQAFSFCIAYLFLAKRDSKVYFWNELIPNFYTLIFNCIAYYIWGLEGLGISFLIAYIFYFIQVYIIAKKRYGFRMESNTVRLSLFQFIIAVFTFLLVSIFESNIITYGIGILLILLSSTLSIIQLNKKIPFINKINFKKRE